MTWQQGFDLSGRVALVTGAAAGIGQAVAELLTTQGAQVALVDKDARVMELAQQLPGEHLGLQADLLDLPRLHQVVATVEQRWGHIDILVNNAGVALLDTAEAVTEQDWDLTQTLNLKVPFFLAQACAGSMRRRRYGRIVNLASQASVVALERHAAYCASKAGLVALTKVLATEWAADGITVNAISPTVVETELGKQAWAGERGEQMKQKIPVGRFAQPAEVAALVMYLISEHAAMITGENMLLDGGYTMV